MKEFFKGVFTDIDGMPSSKRVFGFIVLLAFILNYSFSLFTGKKADEQLSEMMFYLVSMFLLATTSEKFTKRSKSIVVEEKKDEKPE
jgi:hypothetical protein